MTYGMNELKKTPTMFSVMPTNSLLWGKKGKAGKSIKYGEEKKIHFPQYF